MSLLTTLRDSRASRVRELRAILDPVEAEGRNTLTDAERVQFESLNSQIDQLDERIQQVAVQEQRAQQAGAAFDAISRTPVTQGRTAQRVNPLAYTPEALDAIQSAIQGRTSGRFVAGEQEQRAALATTTFGAPRAWGANVLAGPRLLHVAGRVPQQQVDAVSAQLPTLTLPTAGASVGENVTLAEYAASTAGSVTLARFGRWTDLSRESLVGTDAAAIVGAHVVGCALDLDNALISLVNTAAGSAVAFTADVPAAIRKGIATITSATAAADAADITVLVHPDNASLLQDVAPIGGQTIAQGFSRFSGALVYPSTAVPTGFALVANLTAGVRYFEARALQTETDGNVKTGTFTVASSVISGYGNALAGYVTKIDIVTP
jgi:hypothetical protein